MTTRDDNAKEEAKGRYILIRLVLIASILAVGGVLYGLAGPEKEWGTIHIIGIIICAIYFPWEWLFFDKIKRKYKSKR